MSERLTEDLPAPVVAALELDSPLAQCVAGGRVSRFWKSTRDGRPVAVRQSPGFRTPGEVAYEWDLLRHLHEAGAAVAEPISDPVLLDGHVWSVFGWVDGTHLKDAVVDPADHGEFLGRLHGFTAPLADGFGQRPRWGRVDEFMTLSRDDAGLQFADVIGDFEAATGARGRWLSDLARAVDQRLREAAVADLPMCVAHGDFGPHQILMDADGDFVAIIDWDFTHLDLRAADLGIGSSLARPTAARAARFLEGYLRTAALDGTELSLMADFRRAFHLNSLAGHVCWRWLHGHDISPALDAITERLEREQWWGPMLLEAVKAVGHPPAKGRVRLESVARPNPSSLSDLEVAQELADRASVVAAHFFAAGVEAELKDDTTPVTEADRAVEVLLRESIGELRPGDAILGEEFGQLGQSNRVWLVDPIDGTASFARADPNWRIQIALRHGDTLAAAVVDSPALGLRWWASAGGGAFERRGTDPPRQLHVSRASALRRARVDVHPASLAERLPAETTLVPSTRLPLADLIRGDIEAYFVDCCGPWDHAPWILLVLEAGGAFTDHDGGSAEDRRGGLYSNAAVHSELLAALGLERAAD